MKPRMKHAKKLSTLAVILATSLTLAACSSSDDDDDAGVKGSGGVRPARPLPATGAGGLLRRDGSLASCVEASSVLRHGGSGNATGGKTSSCDEQQPLRG